MGWTQTNGEYSRETNDKYGLDCYSRVWWNLHIEDDKVVPPESNLGQKLTKSTQVSKRSSKIDQTHTSEQKELHLSGPIDPDPRRIWYWIYVGLGTGFPADLVIGRSMTELCYLLCDSDLTNVHRVPWHHQ